MARPSSRALPTRRSKSGMQVCRHRHPPTLCPYLSAPTLAAASLELKAEKQSAHNSGVTSVAFSPDGKTIVSGSYDQTLKVWDAARLSGPAPAPAPVRACSPTNSGARGRRRAQLSRGAHKPPPRPEGRQQLEVHRTSRRASPTRALPREQGKATTTPAQCRLASWQKTCRFPKRWSVSRPI